MIDVLFVGVVLVAGMLIDGWRCSVRDDVPPRPPERAKEK